MDNVMFFKDVHFFLFDKDIQNDSFIHTFCDVKNPLFCHIFQTFEPNICPTFSQEGSWKRPYMYVLSNQSEPWSNIVYW